jgi:asparagine synthase (glutamine-hydrolysing)
VSGFFGVVRTDGAPIDERLLTRIAEDLRFRGPDGMSVWSEKGIGGCFALMRTGPVPQAGQQPFQERGRFRLWGDIRLDDRQSLRQQLADAGAAAHDNASSEEYLFRAWQQWGEGALGKVIGDFSFALWDSQERTLWCARDFMGPRPFYYAHVGPVFCFSNTLDVLRRVPGISEDLDESFIGDFLLEGWNMEPSRTVYKDIRRLPAGNLLQWTNGAITTRRFRKLPIEEPLRLKRPEEYVERFLEVVRLAVEDRLSEDATAIYLSGGMDSGAVCAIAADLAGRSSGKPRLKAFTVSWEALLKDPEPAVAAVTAHHLNVEHEVIPIVRIFPGTDAILLTPEPFLEPFSSQDQAPYVRVAAHSRVALTGDGGDDILTGQAWPYLVHLWKRRQWKTLAGDFGGYLWKERKFPPLRGGFRAKINRIFKSEDLFEQYPRWLDAEFETRAHLRERWLELQEEKSPVEHPVHSKAYNFLHSGYWAGLLETEDAGWSGTNLEVRTPLVDLRVLRYFLKLPPVPWCANKHLTREAMRRLLPGEVVDRPKTPMAEGELEQIEPRYIKKRDIDCTRDAREKLERFVNFSKWCETFNAPKGSLTWLNLRPLSLLKWLKAVENAEGIK